MKHFQDALEHYNNLQIQLKDRGKPIPDMEWDAQVCEEVIRKYHFNMYFLSEGKGPTHMKYLSDNQKRFLTACNDILLDGANPYRLLEALQVTEKLYNQWWSGNLDPSELHWKRLIIHFNISPIFAFKGSERMYIDL